jgi:hypothetical protein
LKHSSASVASALLSRLEIEMLRDHDATHDARDEGNSDE